MKMTIKDANIFFKFFQTTKYFDVLNVKKIVVFNVVLMSL